MDRRSKWAFWAFVLAGLAIVCVPSTILIETLRGYARFLGGFEGRPLRPIKTRLVPHRGPSNPSLRPAGPKLEFVEFRLHAPKAKSVWLVGDFNGWKEGTLQLSAQPRGDWELVLPLPAGRHSYLFVVDGVETLDPAAARTQPARGRPASVKEVP